MLDSIAWLFNIRGGDIRHTPVALAFAIVPVHGKASLFIDPAKVGDNVRGASRRSSRFSPRGAGRGAQAARRSQAQGAHRSRDGAGPLRATARSAKAPSSSPATTLASCPRRSRTRPRSRARARRISATARPSPGSSLGSTAEGDRDAADEIAAAMKLEEFRAETGQLKDLSFDTISGGGADMAPSSITGRPARAPDARARRNMLYLIDSGGQYADGTTDVTRTVAIGEPTRRYAPPFHPGAEGPYRAWPGAVPEGHARPGPRPACARRPLWAAGLDFDHGTGHGVGSYLSVHEPPQRLSRPARVGSSRA